jgi:hypothetical protein
MQQYDICNNLKTKFRLYGVKNKKEKKWFSHQNYPPAPFMNFSSFSKKYSMFSLH